MQLISFHSLQKPKVECVLQQVYVDDILLMGSVDLFMSKSKKVLNSFFEITYLGPIVYFLGIKVAKKDDGYFLNRQKYITSLLQVIRMNNPKEVETPLELNRKLSSSEEN